MDFFQYETPLTPAYYSDVAIAPDPRSAPHRAYEDYQYHSYKPDPYFVSKGQHYQQAQSEYHQHVLPPTVKAEFTGFGGPGHQLQHGETAIFGPEPFFPMASPANSPLPYTGRTVSEGTVSSTVSSPKTPRHYSDDEVFHNATRMSGLTDQQLMEMSARDLNKVFKDSEPDFISRLKKKRRTLKNRGYALNSRLKRVQQKSTLEQEKDELQRKVEKLTNDVSLLQKELQQYKERCASLQQLVGQPSRST